MKLLVAIWATSLLGQTPLSMQQAVERALGNYAAVKVSDERIAAAAAGIQYARTAYLPKVDLQGQFNRASRNNVFGMLQPQSTLPSISGPPRPENDMNSAWGSAVGVLITWEPFDLGLRKATVDAAAAAQRRAEAARERTRFEVGAMTLDSYLTLLAAQETVGGAKASIDRAKVLEEVTGALTRAELRPGADLSRVRAERSVAETQLIQAEEAVAVARAALAQFTGPIEAVTKPGSPPEAVASGVAHPALAEQSAAIGEVKAREKALDKSYAPKFAVQGATYARGTGVNPNGTLLGGANGLGPNIANYGLGLTITFPAMAQPAIQAQQSAEAAQERAEAARLKQLQQDLAAQLEKAKARLEGARRIAQQIPVQRQAAQSTLDQATARYKAGLGTIAEVADAQRLLAAAATDEALAQLAIWRALLHVATAQGDLRPFLTLVAGEAGR